MDSDISQKAQPLLLEMTDFSQARLCVCVYVCVMCRAPILPSKTNPLGLSGRLPTFSAFQSASLHHCCPTHLSSCTRVSPHPLKTGPISTWNFLILDKREKTGEGRMSSLKALPLSCPLDSSSQFFVALALVRDGPALLTGTHSAQTTVTSGQDPYNSRLSQPGPCFHPFCRLKSPLSSQKQGGFKRILNENHKVPLPSFKLSVDSQCTENKIKLPMIHVDVSQKPSQYCKAIILQLK